MPEFCICDLHDVLQELVRRVEHLERQEKMEDVTAQLMLLSALRKVGRSW